MKRIFVSIIVIAFISFFIGFLLFKLTVYEENHIASSENDVLINNIQNIETVRTSIEEEKISPNASLILKRVYKNCNHTTRDVVEIPKEIVNLNREEIKEKYSDWEIVSFSSKELVLSKEFDGYCNDHYVIRENNGVIVVYKISNNKEEIFKKTDISTEYLTKQDRKELEDGIEALGLEKVNSILEDFE